MKDWTAWIDEAAAQHKWLVLVIHSILPETWCEGISQADLTAIIDHAKHVKDLWIDTFVNVGAYLRAQHLLESTAPSPDDNGTVWKWSLPPHFPRGKKLRIISDKGTLAQSGRPLATDRYGTSQLGLDDGSLSWRP